MKRLLFAYAILVIMLLSSPELVYSVVTCLYDNYSLQPKHLSQFANTKRPQFSWAAVAGATKYYIEVSNRSPGEPSLSYRIIMEQEITTNFFIPPTDLLVNESGESYWWRVKALVPVEGGRFGWCATYTQSFSFKILPPPVPEDLSLPHNRGTTDTIRPEFRWWDNPRHLEHIDKIQLATDASFRNIVFENTISADGEVQLLCPVDLERGRTYYWRVRFERYPDPPPKDFSCPAAWSSVSSFTVSLAIPPQVVLTSPAFGRSVGSEATFAWDEVPTATEYQLLISQTEDFSSFVLRLFPTTNSVTSRLRFNDGEYFWRVRAKNAAGYGEWSRPFRFTKTSRLPDPVRLRSPENNAAVHNGRPVFEWEGGGLISDLFHLQVSRQSNFSSTVVDKNDIPASDYRTSSPTALMPGVTYYWRMRRQNAAGWGPWSEVRNFVIDLTTVSTATVQLSSPADAATLDSLNEHFSWSSTPYSASLFHIQISRDRNFSSISREDFSSHHSIDIQFPENATYYWRVRAQDEVGWGQWSQIRSVVVNVMRGFAPELYAPEGRINTAKPDFSWRGYAESAYPHPEYHLQVSAYADFRGTILDRTDIHQPTYTPSTNLPSGYDRYYWRVRTKPRSDAEWGQWSGSKSFWISIVAAPIQLKQPENNAVLKNRRPEFSWQAMAFSTTNGYEIEVADRRDFSSSVFRTFIETSTGTASMTPVSDLGDRIYFWHVRQKVRDTWGSWSDVRTFTVDATAPTLRIVSPIETRMGSSTFPARVVVSCEVTDATAGVERVEYYLGSRKVAERNRPYSGNQYVAEVEGLTEGRNTITVKAFDKAVDGGNMGQSSILLTVERRMGIQKQPPVLPERKPGGEIQKDILEREKLKDKMPR